MWTSGNLAEHVCDTLTEVDMKRSKDASKRIPQHDYALALQHAVSWLGDRYLLAEPVPRRKEEPKPFFAEPRRWYDSPRDNRFKRVH
jgi:hypothetical protein